MNFKLKKSDFRDYYVFECGYCSACRFLNALQAHGHAVLVGHLEEKDGWRCEVYVVIGRNGTQRLISTEYEPFGIDAEKFPFGIDAEKEIQKLDKKAEAGEMAEVLLDDFMDDTYRLMKKEFENE